MSVILAMTLAMILATPGVQQVDPDLEYREQFAEYTEIAELTDQAAQATAYLDFLEGGIDDRLLGGVVNGIIQDLAGLTQASRFDEVYSGADRLASLRPEFQLQAGALALEAAAMQGNSEQIIKYGEPFYQTNPSPQVALLLTRSYGDLQNPARMLEYGQIVLDSGAYPLEEIWNIAYLILQEHARNGREESAVTLARRLRRELTQAPQGVSGADWNSIQVYMLDLIGRSDFQAERWREALANFDAILALDARNGKAWYFKGNAMLRTANPVVNDAALALAKATVLQGNYAQPARSLLETTAASNAPGAAATRYVNDKIAQARSELGL
jgi:tetratricopeptide (TPR) repeat protein